MINFSDRFQVICETKSKKVIKAFDTVSKKDVCIKSWDKDDPWGANEIKILASLSKKSIPSFICSFVEGDKRCMVRDWIDATNLYDYVLSEGPFREEDCYRLILKLCDIFIYLHSHIEGPYVYIDLKPDNLLYNKEKDEIWLIDFEAVFNTAKKAINLDEYNTKVLGTELYAGPEVIYGQPRLKSDLYSIGALMLFLLSAKPPVNKKRIKDYPMLGSIIGQCMEYEIDRRIDSVLDLKKSLLSLKAETRLVKPLAREKLLVTVDGNMGFACELAYIAAKEYGYKTGLFEICETEYIMDYYLQFSSDIKTSYLFDPDPFSLGMKSYLNRSLKEWTRQGMLRIFPNTENLYFARPGLLEDLEVNDIQGIKSFCLWARDNFDLVVIAAEGKSNWPVKNALMLNSDFVLAAPLANIDDIQRSLSYYNKLSSHGYISKDNIRYVAWDYIDKVSLPESGISLILGKANYLGAIPFDERRLISRNVEGDFFRVDNLTPFYDYVFSKLIRVGGEKNEKD